MSGPLATPAGQRLVGGHGRGRRPCFLMSLAHVDKTLLKTPNLAPNLTGRKQRDRGASPSTPCCSGTCSQPAPHTLHPSESLGFSRAKPLPTDMTAITAPLNSCQQHARTSHTIQDDHHPVLQRRKLRHRDAQGSLCPHLSSLSPPC